MYALIVIVLLRVIVIVVMEVIGFIMVTIVIGVKVGLNCSRCSRFKEPLLAFLFQHHCASIPLWGTTTTMPLVGQRLPQTPATKTPCHTGIHLY